MFDSHLFEKAAKLLTDSLPESLHHIKKDCQATFNHVLQNWFNQLHVVTREEFEVQAKVLARTRAKVDALEEKINELTGSSQSKPQK